MQQGRYSRNARIWFFLVAVLLLVRPLWSQAGPPFQTDDPEPVDYGHYEAYVFGTVDGTPVEIDAAAPAFEFNWGAVPRVQLHAILPLGIAAPSNNPVYSPSGTGPTTFGLTDMELGVKLNLIPQTKYRPQIGTFTMLELPTGSFSRGLGIGRVWYKLPLWTEKDWTAWSLVGGFGYGVVKQTGYRNYPYGGILLKHTFSKRWDLAAEIFSHGSEGVAAPQLQSSVLLDAGGYYNFKTPGLQLLFAYGHSIAGQTENYAYLGLYRTWGGAGHGHAATLPHAPGNGPIAGESSRHAR